MMRKALFIALALCFALFQARAQVDLEKEFFSLPDTVTNEYLDSLTVQVARPNDYWMVGGYGGASVQMGYFNPDRDAKMQWAWPVYGVSFIRHFTMFGVFPNMGLEFGAQMNYEGYEYSTNPETGYRPVEPKSGAYKLVMQVPEAFILSHFHVDMGEHFKLLAKLGIYGGYRLNISRTLDPAYENNELYTKNQYCFMEHERRLTYGVQGGIGVGLMFSPFEVHLNAQVKWGWESFWEPDYMSQYYYRFAYPLDGAITLGVYYQLTPRYGHTRAQLKKLAKKMIEEQKKSE